NPDEILAVGHDVTHVSQRSLCLAHSTKLPATPRRSPPSSLSGYGHFRTSTDMHGQKRTFPDTSIALPLRCAEILFHIARQRFVVVVGRGGAHMTTVPELTMLRLAYKDPLTDTRGQIAALQAQLQADPAEAAVKALAVALKAMG